MKRTISRLVLCLGIAFFLLVDNSIGSVSTTSGNKTPISAHSASASEDTTSSDSTAKLEEKKPEPIKSFILKYRILRGGKGSITVFAWDKGKVGVAERKITVDSYWIVLPAPFWGVFRETDRLLFAKGKGSIRWYTDEGILESEVPLSGYGTSLKGKKVEVNGVKCGLRVMKNLGNVVKKVVFYVPDFTFLPLEVKGYTDEGQLIIHIKATCDLNAKVPPRVKKSLEVLR